MMMMMMMMMKKSLFFLRLGKVKIVLKITDM
jgi:hypothetical protein